MSGNGNPALGLFGLWMFLSVVFAIALLLGGIYLLYSIGRAAAGLERMADSAEEWVEHLKRATATPAPSGYPRPGSAVPASELTPSAPQIAPSLVSPQTFVPGANNPSTGGPS